MSKVAKIIGVIATVVAVGAAIAATFGGLGIASVGLLTTISAVAGAVAGVANAIAIATAPSQKPPDMKGAMNQVLIGANMPVPLALGRTFVAGNMVYDDSNGTENSDRTQVFVGTVGGPIEGFENFQTDFSSLPFSGSGSGLIAGAASDSWYGADGGYLWLNSRLGLKPDTALTPFSGRPAFRGWDSSSKLSGMAAWSVTMLFDKKGQRWSGGIPAPGMIAKWTKTYDPRKDSTYPGGSGSQRWDDEDTWAYGTAGTGTIAQGESGPLQALAYARGRFIAGNKVVGVGLDFAQINVARFVEAANLADANEWTSHGTVYEGPGISKWDNLKRICATFGAQPVWSGGLLDLKLSKPVVALDTITRDDLAGDSIVVPAMKSWRDRVNTIVPRYRSEPHRWDYVQSDAVTNSTYVTEDGETKTKEIQFDLVQDKDQAAQLGAYELVNGREFGPIQMTCKPRLILMRVGEAVNLDLASLLDDPDLPVQPAVIVSRSVDPATGVISFTFESETAAKHTWALARTGTAPPTPTILGAAAIDQAVSDAANQIDTPTILRNSYSKNLQITSEDAGSSATIHLFGYTGGPGTDFQIDYGTPSSTLVNVSATDLTGKAYATQYFLYADVDFPGDPTPTIGATTNYGDALNSAAHPNRMYLNQTVTTAAAGGGSTGGSSGGGGYGGGDDSGSNPCVTDDTLILMANEARDGPGEAKPFGECAVNDWVWTKPEGGGEEGAFRIARLRFVAQPVFDAGEDYPRASENHRFARDDGKGWSYIETIGEPAGEAIVGQVDIAGASTYYSARPSSDPRWVLSHNLKPI